MGVLFIRNNHFQGKKMEGEGGGKNTYGYGHITLKAFMMKVKWNIKVKISAGTKYH